ncbi:tellurite resistance protein TerC [Dietzia kunjamensis subsp. schimae]|uniref:TerC family protein n=2 Tax=Dietzia TaxID=37914 RepID=A0A365PCB4_9ACTN|nr:MULTISPECIES: TerC/Alx family metal homeostasis membrane protein [Dietzia]MBB0990151.1 TerC/Alx family metal homeostasis membrane protein [Dietzia sp. SLG510A3-30A2]MBB0992937.1 TerC/Alx family metal homeostasis membrane protein [Dietzia sp. SLG510A3-40A3]MBB1009432.1 TerC/Alx family metal homeostasis membrane protein [Dietzia sp. SLG510A3-3B2-2]HBD21524.1 transporter [Dietzia sp.]MBB1016037.1 TerC/Alx family metal homeostasis membrane protein [Dietzia kunjamensis subsp. schimae]
MGATPLAWSLSVGLIIALLLFDYFFHVRKEHIPTLKESAIWSALYVGIALIFGGVVWIFGGTDMGVEYFAGYITEKALSVDNLFVFLLLLTSFKVPRAGQQKALLFGIVFSIIARTAFIFVGAALLNKFAVLFYIFGLFLIVTAGRLLAEDDEDDDADNVVVRLAKRFIPATDHYDHDKLFTIENGKRVMTPMMIVMVAIGGTDIMFALDSIPAIFGLTQNVFIVFTATTFSLLGLRQLYFLLDGLLDRLVYLKYGLAAILGFIGVKLILHALHENNLPFINGGEHVDVVEVPTFLSLGIIVGVLVVTVLGSLLSPAGKALTVLGNLKRHSLEYLDKDFVDDPVERAKLWAKIVENEDKLKDIERKYFGSEGDVWELEQLLRRVWDEQGRYEKATDYTR